MNIATLKIIQTLIHYGLHFVFPLVIALVFFKDDWKKTYLILLCTMLVDLDHLLATPIFEPGRCSIGFHPLHSYYAIAVYFLLLFQKNKLVKIIAIGLLFHMFTDYQDCRWNEFILNYGR
ncbi:MAG: DUF6122 family protein [Bacteroidota bacterium]